MITNYYFCSLSISQYLQFLTFLTLLPISFLFFYSPFCSDINFFIPSLFFSFILLSSSNLLFFSFIFLFLSFIFHFFSLIFLLRRLNAQISHGMPGQENIPQSVGAASSSHNSNIPNSKNSNTTNQMDSGERMQLNFVFLWKWHFFLAYFNISSLLDVCLQVLIFFEIMLF